MKLYINITVYILIKYIPFLFRALTVNVDIAVHICKNLVDCMFDKCSTSDY